jgi:hypothetical protein
VEGNTEQHRLEQAGRVKRRHGERLRGYPNVNGVGVGYRVRGGIRQPEVVVRVYVRRKVPAAELGPEELLPSTVDGVGVDVIEADFVAQLTPEERSSFRQVAVPAGVSVGSLRVTAGTWGATVTDPVGRELLLSNWHVLCASDRCEPGEPIVQPGPYDGGEEGTDVVARLTRWHLSERVDCACAELTGNRFANHEIADLGSRPIGTEGIYLGLRVVKSGRTTGVTHGVVVDVDADVEIGDYPVYGTRHFVGQAVVEAEPGLGPFSGGGDSGSLVLAEEGAAVGLLFAGDGTTTIINHIDDVVDALELDFGPQPLAVERVP